jgi:hypothetical protein
MVHLSSAYKVQTKHVTNNIHKMFMEHLTEHVMSPRDLILLSSALKILWQLPTMRVKSLKGMDVCVCASVFISKYTLTSKTFTKKKCRLHVLRLSNSTTPYKSSDSRNREQSRMIRWKAESHRHVCLRLSILNKENNPTWTLIFSASNLEKF